MCFRSLLQNWLASAAKGKLAEALIQAAQSRLSQPASPLPSEEPQAAPLGLIFALGIESGCFEDLLQGVITIRGGGFVGREGGLNGRRVVILLSGPGRQNAARATEALIDGHRPRRVVSAGFAGGLCPELKFNDILVADQLVSTEGGQIDIELPAGLAAAFAQPGVHRGRLLTTDHVVRLPADRQALFQRYGAMAVDMETIAVAEVCRRRQVPFSSIRVVNDTADQALPRDVEYLLRQKTPAAQIGTPWRQSRGGQRASKICTNCEKTPSLPPCG